MEKRDNNKALLSKYYKNYIIINQTYYLFITFEDNLKENFINVDNISVSIINMMFYCLTKLKAI